MRSLTRPVALLFAGLTVVAAVAGMPALVAMGLIGWVASVAFHTFREQAARNRAEAALESLPAAARLQARRLQTAYDQLKQMIELHSGRTAVRVVGHEALIEADNVLDHALRLIQARSELERTLRARSQASVELRRLQDAESRAESGPVRDAIHSAIAAKTAEIERYNNVVEAMERIDAQLVQAESTLSELKSQIAMAGAEAAEAHDDLSGLNGVVSELRALGSSLQEAQTLLEDTKA